MDRNDRPQDWARDEFSRLVDRLIAGDANAANELGIDIARCAPYLVGYAIDVEAITPGRGWSDAMRNFAGFAGAELWNVREKLGSQKPENRRGYAIAVLRNTLYKLFRAKKRRREEELDSDAIPTTDEPERFPAPIPPDDIAIVANALDTECRARMAQAPRTQGKVSDFHLFQACLVAEHIGAHQHDVAGWLDLSEAQVCTRGNALVGEFAEICQAVVAYISQPAVLRDREASSLSKATTDALAGIAERDGWRTIRHAVALLADRYARDNPKFKL